MADTQQDFTFRIQNSDLTKAVARWLNEGMGITKDNIEGYLQEALDSRVKKYLKSAVTAKNLESLFMSYVEAYFRRMNLNYNGFNIKSLSDLAEAMIKGEVKSCVDKTIRKIVDEYLTITYSPKPSVTNKEAHDTRTI